MATLSPELALVDPDLAALAREFLPDPLDCLAPRPRARAEAIRPTSPASAEVHPIPALRELAEPTDPPPERAQPAPLVPEYLQPVAPLPRPSQTAAPVPVPSAAEPVRPRRGRVSVVSVVATLFAALVIGSPALDLIPGTGSDRPTLAQPESTRKPIDREVIEPSQPDTPSPSKPKAKARTVRRSSAGSASSGTGGASKSTPKQKASSDARTGKKTAAPSSTTGSRDGASRRVRVKWQPVKGADLYNLIFWGSGKRVKDMWVTTSSVLVNTRSSNRRGALPPGEYVWFAYPGYREGKRVKYGDLAGSGSLKVVSQSRAAR
jgi:hypothetical protein